MQVTETFFVHFRHHFLHPGCLADSLVMLREATKTERLQGLNGFAQQHGEQS